jgi:hypothetical protein
MSMVGAARAPLISINLIYSEKISRWVIVKVSRMQYTELNSWVTSLKDAHGCAQKIADVLTEKTYIDF